MMPLSRTLAAIAILAALVAPAAAAEARASGNLAIRSGPGEFYPRIRVLPDGEYVELSRCTRHAYWCRIVYADGPDGWVLGDYLVGAPAKLGITPPEFTNPLGMFD